MTEYETQLMFRGIEAFRRENCRPTVAVVQVIPPLHTATQTEAKRLLASVCETHGITAEDLRGKSHEWRLVTARRDLAKQLRTLQWSFPRIGDFLGYRHHTTIIALVTGIDRAKLGRRRELDRAERLKPQHGEQPKNGSGV